MLAGVLREVDALLRDADPRERGVHGGVDGRDEGDHAAVVRHVGRDVEHDRALDAGDGVTDGGDDLGAASLGEVRNAFDELHAGIVGEGV
jgi:hypothetical protein